MKSNQQLSPKKHIETKARKLPVYKCFVTAGWQEAGITIRIHTGDKNGKRL